MCLVFVMLAGDQHQMIINILNYDHANSISPILSTKFLLIGKLYSANLVKNNFLILLGPRPLVAFKNVDKGVHEEMTDVVACIGCIYLRGAYFGSGSGMAPLHIVASYPSLAHWFENGDQGIIIIFSVNLNSDLFLCRPDKLLSST